VELYNKKKGRGGIIGTLSKGITIIVGAILFHFCFGFFFRFIPLVNFRTFEFMYDLSSMCYRSAKVLFHIRLVYSQLLRTKNENFKEELKTIQ